MQDAQLAEVDTWLDQYTAASATAQAGTVAAVLAAYDDVDDWYAPALTIAAAQAAAAASRAGQQTIGGLAQQWTATVTQILTGARVIQRRLEVMYPRNAEPFDVYSRPVWDYRETIAHGGSEADALAAARLRAETVAIMDTILAERDAAMRQAVESRDQGVGVTHFRRVLRPELSKSGSCGLCIAASTQVYTYKALMPIHDHCNCKVMPIVDGDDPARTLNAGDLEQLYADAGSTRGRDLKRTRYAIDEHGELGPVLIPKRRADQPAPRPVLDDKERAAKELAALLPVLDSLEQRAAAGQDVSGPLEYQRNRIAQLRAVVDG